MERDAVVIGVPILILRASPRYCLVSSLLTTLTEASHTIDQGQIVTANSGAKSIT